MTARAHDTHRHRACVSPGRAPHRKSESALAAAQDPALRARPLPQVRSLRYSIRAHSPCLRTLCASKRPHRSPAARTSPVHASL